MTARSDLVGRLSGLRSARVLCVGDVMLDRFVYGEVDRISPEAPVPVLRIERESAMLGGAGALTGKLRQRHHRAELAKALEDAIEPGHSGIVALVSDPRAVRIRTALAQADAIVEHAIDKVVADDIKAAAESTADADAADADAAGTTADERPAEKDDA